MLSPIFSFIQKGDLAAVKGILRQDPEALFAKNESGNTPVVYAFVAKQGGIADYLISQLADLDNMQHTGSNRPLLVAALRTGMYAQCVTLLARGADPFLHAEHLDKDACFYHEMAGIPDGPDIVDMGRALYRRCNQEQRRHLVIDALVKSRCYLFCAYRTEDPDFSKIYLRIFEGAMKSTAELSADMCSLIGGQILLAYKRQVKEQKFIVRSGTKHKAPTPKL